MKRLVVLFVVLLLSGVCTAQHVIEDSMLTQWWDEYPAIRPFLKQQFSDLFQKAELDTTLFDGWKVYKIDGTHWCMVQKSGENWTAIVDLGNKNQGYVKTFINSDSVLVIGSAVKDDVPAHVQTAIDRIKQ